MPKISVIVPVYNVEKYINSCVNSILSQSFSDFELILIDDGSPDNCGEICDGYSQTDCRVRVIHQNNSGVSAARNSGLEVALGQYVIFVDSDDYLFPNALDKYMKIIAENDLCILGYYRIDENDDIIGIMSGSCSQRKLSQKEAIRLLFDESRSVIEIPGKYGYQGYLWNKIFRMELIKEHNIRFDECICYNEDRLFILNYLTHSTVAIICNEPIYGYRLSSGAMSRLNEVNDGNIDLFLTEMDAYEKMVDIIGGEEYIEERLGCIYATAQQYEKWYKKSYYTAKLHRRYLQEKVLYWAERLYNESEKQNKTQSFRTGNEILKELRKWRWRNILYSICDRIVDYI